MMSNVSPVSCTYSGMFKICTVCSGHWSCKFSISVILANDGSKTLLFKAFIRANHVLLNIETFHTSKAYNSMILVDQVFCMHAFCKLCLFAADKSLRIWVQKSESLSRDSEVFLIVCTRYISTHLACGIKWSLWKQQLREDHSWFP